MNDDTRSAVLASLAGGAPSRPPDVDRAVRRGMRTLRLRLAGWYLGVVGVTAAVLVLGTSLTTVARQGGTEPASTVRSVEVVPEALELLRGEERRLTVRATADDGGVTDVRDGVAWRSSDVAVADVARSSGLVTARSAGTATITATHRGRSSTTTVTVLDPPVTPTSVRVTPGTVVLAVTGVEQLTTTVTWSDGSSAPATADDGVVWRSSDPAVVALDDVPGRVRAGGPGTATVTATVHGLSASAAVSVLEPATTLTRLAVVPDVVVLEPGARRQLAARAAFSDGTVAEVAGQVEWRSSDADVARPGAAGTVVAGRPGTAVITATLGERSATAEVTVREPPRWVSIAVTPATAGLVPDGQTELTVTATSSDGSTTDVREGVDWQTDDPKVADVDPTGLATARGPGRATVTATWAGMTADAVITVDRPVTLTSLAVTPAATTLAVGGTQPLTVTATFSDGSTSEVREGVGWRTDDPKVAGVDAAGLATAHGPGTATVTAVHGGLTADATITVERPPVTLTSVTVTPAEATLARGDRLRFTATATFSDGSTSEVREGVDWGTGNPDVAQVDPSGLATANGPGATALTASYGGMTGGARLAVVVLG